MADGRETEQDETDRVRPSGRAGEIRDAEDDASDERETGDDLPEYRRRRARAGSGERGDERVAVDVDGHAVLRNLIARSTLGSTLGSAIGSNGIATSWNFGTYETRIRVPTFLQMC